MNLTKIHPSWQQQLQHEFTANYFKELDQFVEQEYLTETIYPPKEEIFNALNLTSFNEVKVVILGQDPYHGPNQAHGLSFSVLPGNKIPPSLRNIYKELESDLQIPPVSHGCLTNWAEQGVLLLNTVLTVRDGQPNSHQKRGWETFTDKIMTHLNNREQPVIFVLWGKPAQAKQALITNSQHLILTAPHPSPLSAHRGFFGTKPFSQINQFLAEYGQETISWALPDKL